MIFSDWVEGLYMCYLIYFSQETVKVGGHTFIGGNILTDEDRAS